MILRGIITLCFTFLFVSAQAQTLTPTSSPDIDFRYRPFHWETVISEPTDWLKTTVNQRGALTFDYGPGPYATPGTQVYLEVEGGATVGNINWSRRVQGMVEYDLYTPNGDLISQSNLRWPNGQSQGEMPTQYRRRVGEYGESLGWLKVPEGVDPAFGNIAWNPNRDLIYEVKVNPGAKKRIALGWADGRYVNPMHRVMDAEVEGAAIVEIAPVREAGQGKPYVHFFDAHDRDGDGWIRVRVAPSKATIDPNVFLSGIWVYPQGSGVTAGQVVSGAGRSSAELVIDCGSDFQPYRAGRTDLIVAESGQVQAMRVVVRTNRRLEMDAKNKQLTMNGRLWLTTVPAAIELRATEGGYELLLPLSSRVVVSVMHGLNPRIPSRVEDADQAMVDLATVWQQHREAFPFPITVPDPTMQEVLEANWDNLHRMKDTVETKQQYHIGPSVYRGLWVVDATMLMQGALVMGDTSGARSMVESVATHQKANGQVEVMVPHALYRETANFIQQMVMYAEYSGDDAWLLNRWDQLKRGIAYLQELRNSTLSDPNAIYYGLFPPGFTDGGLAGVNPEYSSVYYTLGALHSALRTVKRLEMDEPELDNWRRFYVDLRTAFNASARRDMRKDEFGNWFLPMRIGETDPKVRPTMAQWGILEAINLAEMFSKGDTLAEGTMSVLLQHTSQGLAVGTGWLEDALWPWFSMIQGAAHVHMEQPEAAVGLLYDIANHGSPLGTWVEEQQPRALGQRTGGDQSNASGSALYLTMLRRMLVNERGGTLELLPAVPEFWLGAGQKITVDKTLTHWGALSLETEVAEDGGSLTIRWSLDQRADRKAPRMVLRPEMLAKAGFKIDGAIELEAQGQSITIIRNQ